MDTTLRDGEQTSGVSFSVSEKLTLSRLLLGELNVDRIWHLACPASPLHYQRDPIETARTNFLGTYNMLELARKNKSKILFASTSEIYGDPDSKNVPTKENYNGNLTSMGPRSCYDESKRLGETLCYIFNKY